MYILHPRQQVIHVANIFKTSRLFVPLFSGLGLSICSCLFSTLKVRWWLCFSPSAGKSLVPPFSCTKETLVFHAFSSLSAGGSQVEAHSFSPLLIPSSSSYSSFLFFPFSFSFPLSSSLLVTLLLYFSPNPFTSTFLHPPQPPTLLNLQPSHTSNPPTPPTLPHLQPSHTSNPSLRSLYLPGAFLCSDELTELAGTFRCLDSIDFKLVHSTDIWIIHLHNIALTTYILGTMCTLISCALAAV